MVLEIPSGNQTNWFVISLGPLRSAWLLAQACVASELPIISKPMLTAILSLALLVTATPGFDVPSFVSPSSPQPLEGTVLFCPDVFVTPDGRIPSQCVTTQIPGSWTSVSNSNHGTYLFEVQRPDVTQPAALYLYQVLSAYRLFVDGKERVQVGTPSTTGEDIDESTAVQIVTLDGTHSTHRVVLWVSSHPYFRKGLVHRVTAGPEPQIKKLRQRRLISEGFLVGLMLFGAMLNGVLGGIARRREAGGWITLFCLCLAGRTLFEGEYLILELVESMEWSTRANVVLVSSFLATCLLGYYLKSDFQMTELTWLCRAAAGLTLLSALTPWSEMAWFEPGAQLLTMFFIAVMLRSLWRAARAGDGAAKVILLGLLMVAVSAANDISYDLLGAGFLPTRTALSFGLAVLVLSQSIATAFRYERESIAALQAQATIEHKLESTQAALMHKAKLAEERAQMTEASHHEKVRIFQEINHELRTPLSLILQPLEDASKRLPDLVELNVAYRHAKRLETLVEQLLVLEQPPQSEKTRESASFSLRETLDFIAEESAPIFGYFDLSLTHTSYLEAYDEAPISGDRDTIVRVVFNLLSNALKFADDQSTVQMALRRSPGDDVEVTLTNQGPVLTNEEQELIFEPFHKTGHRPHREIPSSGIGLTYARKAIANAGGTLSACSDAHGTHFILKLPSIAATDTVIRDTKAPSAHLALLGSEGQSNESNSRKEHAWSPTANDIIIVEDNTDLRDRMEAQLQSQGFSCHATANAEEALTHLDNQSRPPTLIIADWMLPGMTGLEFIKALRSNDIHTDLPVFIVSARADQQSRNEALIAGAVSYMAKPFGMQDFVARVQALVGRRQSLSELNREAKSVLIGNLATYLSDAFINPLTSVRQTLSLLVHDPSIHLDRQHHQMLFKDELAAIDRLASFLQTLSRMTESLAITTFFAPCETIENSLTSLPQDRWDFIATPLADDEDLVWQGTTALLSFGVTELLLWWIEPQFEAGQRIGISLEKLGPNQLCLKLSGSRREGLGARSEQGLKMVEDLWALSHWSVQALEDDAHIKVLLTANKAKPHQEIPSDNTVVNQEQAATESEPSPIG